MAYTPRTTSPSYDNKWWIHTSYGGKNSCIWIQGNSVLPNCVGYAWGRFGEIMGKTPKLSRGDAGTWYSYASDGYARGSKPKLGAVACWSKPGGAGHVAIVEKIYSDGSIMLSESGYGSFRFRTSKHSPPNYYYSSYIFQGFIYNPAVNTTSYLDQFVSTAYSHVGENNSWTCKVTGHSKSQHWSAAFVWACAKTVKISGKVITGTSSISKMIQNSIKNYDATFHLGPHFSYKPTPKKGDVIVLRWGKYDTSDIYKADQVGIVRKVDSKTVYTIEGDVSGVVKFKSYDRSSTSISGYLRPNWSTVDGGDTAPEGSTSGYLDPLYSTETTREDAIVREVGYVNSNYKPSIQSSNIRLSVLNYTNLLGDLFEIYRTQYNQTVQANGGGINNTNVNTDRITDKNCKKVINYLLDKGLNGAASAAIAANIYHESGFRTDAVGDNGTSFGICQWHYGRGDNMKKMAGANWRNNLTGQLDYLWYELTHSYDYVLDDIKKVKNTLEGCKKATDIFIRKFEIPADVDRKSIERQKTAASYWNKLIIQNV